VWQTAVTPAGIEKLKTDNPKLEVVLDDAEASTTKPPGS
jgi:hypothetical protein